jgi:hypothetical protein
MRNTFTIHDLMVAWQFGFIEGQLDPSEWSERRRHAGGRPRKYATDHEFAAGMAEAIREHMRFTKTGPRVIDVALAMGFESESGLRAAKKRFRESPQVAQAWAVVVSTDPKRETRSGSPD